MNLNLQCPINQLGYGIVSINIFKELIKQNSVSLWPIGPIDCDEELILPLKNSIFSASYFDKNAPSLKIWHQWDMALNPGKGTHLGMTFFEIDPISKADVHSLNSLDKIIVSSSWAKDVCEKSGVDSSKICIVNLGVDKTIFKNCEIKSGGPTKIVNIGKWEIRKGHDLIIPILEQAFEENDNFEFHIYPNNPFLNNDESNEWESFYKNSKFGNKIYIHKERYKTQSELYESIKDCDIGIFPYRSEAWNMELMELLSIGKHCIATNYSGPTQFAKSLGCNLVDIDGMERAYDGKWFLGNGYWAKLGPSFILKFSTILKNLHVKKQNNELTTNKIGQDNSELYSWKECCINILKEV